MINQIYCGECTDVMKTFPDECIDLTVTSPPYDTLRTYNGYVFPFEDIAKELFRITKIGGVVVWVVGDTTKNFCESLTSFKQAIYFVEQCGFNLLDTMIYEKLSYAPGYPTLRRYSNVFEYMFVFCKGKPKTIHYQKELKSAHTNSITTSSYRKKDLRIPKHVQSTGEYKQKTNIWKYRVGMISKDDTLKYNHPATFPDLLAHDHILSWSNEGDSVLDPMCGSGTTLKMAKQLQRNYIGIDISQEYVEIAKKRVE